MFRVLQVLAILLAATALVPALAHALELPGKLRLGREQYLAVQTIYYPGFTIAGIGEIASIPAALALTILTPQGTAQFWLTLGALAALVTMHALYWVLTHPVNNFWLKDVDLEGVGKSFFAFGAVSRDASADWTTLRDRWEYSHVVRAVLAVFALVLLAAAATL